MIGELQNSDERRGEVMEDIRISEEGVTYDDWVRAGSLPCCVPGEWSRKSNKGVKHESSDEQNHVRC